MIAVEDLLEAYALAYDLWLDPESERKCPTPEYANLIRQAVSDENKKLRELVEFMHCCYVSGHDWGPWGAPEKQWVEEQMRELGVTT